MKIDKMHACVYTSDTIILQNTRKAIYKRVNVAIRVTPQAFQQYKMHVHFQAYAYSKGVPYIEYELVRMMEIRRVGKRDSEITYDSHTLAR